MSSHLLIDLENVNNDNKDLNSFEIHHVDIPEFNPTNIDTQIHVDISAFNPLNIETQVNNDIPEINITKIDTQI